MPEAKAPYPYPIIILLAALCAVLAGSATAMLSMLITDTWMSAAQPEVLWRGLSTPSLPA